jgi:hypothetical protein
MTLELANRITFSHGNDKTTILRVICNLFTQKVGIQPARFIVIIVLFINSLTIATTTPSFLRENCVRLQLESQHAIGLFLVAVVELNDNCWFPKDSTQFRRTLLREYLLRSIPA